MTLKWVAKNFKNLIFFKKINFLFDFFHFFKKIGIFYPKFLIKKNHFFLYCIYNKLFL